MKAWKTKQAQIIDPDTAAAWAKTVMQNQKVWQQKSAQDGILGDSYYQNEDKEPYHFFAVENNATVRKLLPGFKEAMLSCAEFLPRDVPMVPRSPAKYWVEMAVCVFGRNPKTKSSYPFDLHVDLTGLCYRPETLFDPKTEAYSVMLALACPEKGGGLYVGQRDVVVFGPGSEKVPDASTKNCTLHDYAPGRMTIINSFCWHGIQPYRLSKAHPRRITGTMHVLYRAEPKPHYEYWF